MLHPAARRPASFADSLEVHGDRLAVAAGEVELSYRELAARADAVAAQLGEQPRLVLVAGANHLDAFVTYLAALRGGHVVLLAPGSDAGHVAGLIEAFDPDVVAADEGSGWSLLERRPGTAHTLHPELALLLSTSGSTGSPRLVRLSTTNLQANAAAIAEYLGLTPDDRAVTSLPLHYCYGLSVINSHLAVGAGIVLTDLSVVDRCFWDAFRRHGATSLAGVPHTFELLDRAGFESMDLPTLRYVTQAGGRMAAGQVRRWAQVGREAGWDLFVMYGQTEATARIAYLPPDLAVERPGTIGVPIPGGSLALDLGAGAGDGVGELVYRGANVMLGYADHPGDLSEGATVAELRTGDLARRADDGLYEIVGRTSRFAKVFGLRIDLEHLEGRLADEGIAAVCTSDDRRILVGVTDASQRPVAARLVRRITGLPPSRLEVRHLPDVPRLPNGKPDYLALCQPVDEAGASPDPDLAAEQVDGVHPAVRACVARILQRTDVTATDTFVDLGGDSLSYVEMSIALEEVLGDLPDGWQTAPLGRLVPAVRGRRTRVETSVVLRAVGIVLVVGTHSKLFDVLGGAAILLAVAGFNFARFQAGPGRVARSAARIAVPSAMWLGGVALTDPRVDWTHVALVNGFVGHDRGHGGYWFIEAIVQILVVVGLVLAVPAVRRAEQRAPFEAALAALAAGLAVRFHLIDLPTVEPHDIRPHDIFWLFAVGWAAARATTAQQRLLVSLVLAAALPGYFGEPWRELVVLAGGMLLIWVPTLRVPRRATRPLGAVAAASLYVYLTHWQVFPPVRDRFGAGAALGASLLAGVAAWSLSRRVEGRLTGRRRRPRSVSGSGGRRADVEADAGLPF